MTKTAVEVLTRFAPNTTKAERNLALKLLSTLKRHDDGWTPTNKYTRQLVVKMPTFQPIGLDLKDYTNAG
jgi:hypothetical protein